MVWCRRLTVFGLEYICHMPIDASHIIGVLTMTESLRARRQIPLNPRNLMVLLGLAEGPTHGYEIKKRAEERSEGKVMLDAGSLYRTLAQFLSEGMIREVEGGSHGSRGDARRRVYELTPVGREVLTAEVERLEGLVDFARSQQLIGTPEGAR
jgi:DNA-binding PadR family transcriptional regulator